MIFVAHSSNRHLFSADLAVMHRQRKRIFVDGMGWKLPVIRDMEIDGYDREDTTYLLSKDELDGEVLASARLLTTDGRHLMSDLFAGACQQPAPRGSGVWEVSRFCVAPGMTRRVRLRLLWQITCGVMELGLLHGIEQVVFVANRALLPLMLNCGWEARVLGPTLPDGNDAVTAVAARLSEEALAVVRRRYEVAAPALASPCRLPPESSRPGVASRNAWAPNAQAPRLARLSGAH